MQPSRGQKVKLKVIVNENVKIVLFSWKADRFTSVGDTTGSASDQQFQRSEGCEFEAY